MKPRNSKRKKRIKIRVPLPIKPEKPHSTKKGLKGYNRKKEKKKAKELFSEILSGGKNQFS